MSNVCCFYFPMQASLGDDSKLVVLATPLALYAARGPPGSVTLESVFLPYTTSVSACLPMQHVHDSNLTQCNASDKSIAVPLWLGMMALHNLSGQ
jgi:hypothetical protein